MQSTKAKVTKQEQHNVPVTLSTSSSASVYLTTITNRIAARHGVSFLILKPVEYTGQTKEPQESIKNSMKGAIAKGSTNNPQAMEKFKQSAEMWSAMWAQPSGSVGSQVQTQHRVRPILPASLLLLFSDMGMSKPYEPLGLLGLLKPEDEVVSRCFRGAEARQSPLQPVICIYLNALESIIEVTDRLSAQAKAMYCQIYRENALKRGTDVANHGGNSTKSADNSPEKCRSRFFLLTPSAPYAALRETANRIVNDEDTGLTGTSLGLGEACEILLVYDLNHSSHSFARDHSPECNPEVWGHVNYQQKRSGNSSGDAHERDELFFIAQTLEDYFRLGSTFSWVYGWQLCYASQGPPARSLSWLKLFSPNALAAVVTLNALGSGSKSTAADKTSAITPDADTRTEG
ncbi:unnamed protein product [Trypanosoma congolense IL3000]|uniref:WGS project CAEQ00000000 data, annotated contig 97 n=1 Tax=Trypanosoma congolense (strain IL3000) TaxID=1068625 RepID=F9WK13_TRYCI|nr:unnamed protein product [Trypanosoma congolense IL3000]